MNGLVYYAPSGVDTTAKVALGSLSEDGNGNEYIYLQGAAGVALGSCVSYNPATFATTIGAGTAAGRVAFAMGPVLAGQFGWFCIKGTCPCVVTGGAPTVGNAVGLAATGQVTGTVAATDRIENAYFASVGTAPGSVSIIYPQAIALG